MPTKIYDKESNLPEILLGRKKIEDVMQEGIEEATYIIIQVKFYVWTILQ